MSRYLPKIATVVVVMLRPYRQEMLLKVFRCDQDRDSSDSLTHHLIPSLKPIACWMFAFVILCWDSSCCHLAGCEGLLAPDSVPWRHFSATILHPMHCRRTIPLNCTSSGGHRWFPTGRTRQKVPCVPGTAMKKIDWTPSGDSSNPALNK